MTARKPVGRPCHIDPDLAHIVTRPDEELRPCTRRHKQAPAGLSTPELTRLGLAPRTRVKLLPDDVSHGTPPPKDPPATSSAARSAPKRATPAKRPGASYDERERLVALDFVVTSGIAGAHKATGIPKATLSRWAKAAGIDLEAQARDRTRAATAALEAAAAEASLTTVARLEHVLELELTTHARLVELEAAASASMAAAIASVRAGEQPVEAQLGMMGTPYLVLRQPDSELGQLLGLLELGKTLAKRDVVGAWTRAVHDLALLKGDATERGTILVRFGIPRPAGDVDAGVVDEVELAAEPKA